MRTVKEVSDLTGVSVRALHYYDEIGLLKPSKVTDSGYRLYDDETLDTLHQILFFKELDISLKEIKDIMSNPNFDKKQALKNQKELLILKRDRLNDLIELINKRIRGENAMSFKEFDMSQYLSVLEEFKNEHEDEIIKYHGSKEEFSKFIDLCKTNEENIAKMAIKQYGSIEKYTEAMKNNLDNFSSIMEKIEDFKKDYSEEYTQKSSELFNRLISDLNKDPKSKEIQQIVEEINQMNIEQYKFLNMDMGENYWGLMADLYSSNPVYIEIFEKKYGSGTSKFVGEAFKFYSENN
ncbi:MerR family transcriptional regulator [Clostridium sp. 'White wine YQ']|uniref:MerR family transcriptional regulator n=1 Tax=Clostridium sp. 'White wine YQ' TaxID=3027474 RepID=UPI0023661816|nr:MerR family transcriptional regulator [Clostridium sp. 'White wine YQ']MDD7793577.1 MerR family transcriptional regulator [Clostridium sp. 'White wine YQ']